MPRKNSSRPATPEICPVCGDDVPPRSLACPECGADHRSGWRDDADLHDGAGLPDDDFDYDTFVQNEFGGGSPRPAHISPLWWITALVLLLVLASGYLLTLLS